MQFENLELELSNGILTIRISRESKMNALNNQTIEELSKAFDEVYRNSEIRGVILTGAGTKSFVAGADISEISHLDSRTSLGFVRKGQSVFTKIENCHKPVICAVNGFALGGGCELAMACHIRVASENARFGQPEVNLGIIPGYGGTQRLTMYIGKSRALELMMTGDMIDAKTAMHFGLVSHVVTMDELIPKCIEILNKVSTKASIAIGKVIDCVNAYYRDTDGYLFEAEAFADCCETKDFSEGTSAFLEKRKPEFQGA